MSLASVIIPAKNEENNIAKTITAIRDEFGREKINFEIVVVNDHSTDGTRRVVEEMGRQDQRIRAVDNDAAFGIGYAIRKGFEVYKGDLAIIAMADSSDDPKDMVKFVRAIEEGFDCCFGNRWCREAVILNYPKHKLAINRFVNFGMSVLFGVPYRDITNAFKCYSRQTINGIKPVLSRHFNITVELPLKAIVRKYKYKVVPTNWYNRRIGKSNLKLKEMGSRYFFIMMYVLMEKFLCGQDYHKK